MTDSITLFLCGDVMTGRGIDQILPFPSDPQLYEPAVTDAREYVALAEKAAGPILKPVDFPYIWGDAFAEPQRIKPDVRIINLETSVTKSNDYWKGKGINYRMHPKNVPCLGAGGIDCCSLANNHVLDWGYAGLMETLKTLRTAGIKTAGAGRDMEEARRPAVFEVAGRGRVVVFGYGSVTAGIPATWAASSESPGINLLENLGDRAVGEIAEEIRNIKHASDVVVVSIHWGANWGYEVPREQIVFAHKLVDEAGVDVVHGHSSHHAKGIELYRDKIILYGCGDFINDYEGIGGYEEFRADLSLMYFPSVDPATGNLRECRLVPAQTRHFKANFASAADARWLGTTLNAVSKKFATRIEAAEDNTFTVKKIE